MNAKASSTIAAGLGGAGLLTLAAVMAHGCAFPIPALDIDAPRVVSSSPVGSAPTTTPVSVTFSRPIMRERLEVPNAFVLVRTEELTSTFLSDLNNPPLIASRRALVEEGQLVISEDDLTLTFFPARALEGETSYTYLVSRSVTDANDNPLVIPMLDEDGEIVVYPDSHPSRPGETVYVAGSFEAEFVTGRSLDVEGPLVVERFPEQGSANVPPNLASVMVRFDRAAFNVTPRTFRLMDQAGMTIGAREVRLTEQRTRAELLLDDELDLSTEYRIVLSLEISDEAGGALDEELNESAFSTAACLDDTPPIMDPEGIEVTPVDTYAIIRWLASEPSTGLVRHGALEPDLVTEGGAAVCELPGFDPCAEPPIDAVCRNHVRVDGLEPETTYVFQVESTDAAGNTAVSGLRELTTLPPLPKLVLNELQPTPDVTPQSEAEFVEIYNAGEEPVDLTGWMLVDQSASSPTPRVLQPLDPWPTELEPGEYALVVGTHFDRSHYPMMDASVLMHTATTAPLGGLTDSRHLEIELLSPEGAMVSSFGGWFRGQDNRGRSIERIDPSGPDERSNWGWAEDPPRSTPGYRNSLSD